MNRPSEYAIKKAARYFDDVHDGHVAWAISQGWSAKKATKEFGRLQARRDLQRAAQNHDLTRGGEDPRAARIRRLAGKDVPRWLLQKALDENWPVATAATAFLKAIREGVA